MKGKYISRAVDKSGDKVQVLVSHVNNSHAVINRCSNFFRNYINRCKESSFMFLAIPIKYGRNNTVSGGERRLKYLD